MAIVAIATTLATVNAQTSTFAGMSNNQLRQELTSTPWRAEVKMASAGQDVDVLTISQTEDGDTTVFWQIRPYTGFRLGAEAGFSATWRKNGANRLGAAVNIGIGYVRRSWGFDFFAGLNGLGKEKGLMQLTLQPFYTPLRWGSADNNRFDIGLIGGVQQASASSAVRFEDSNSWSNQRLSTNLPRLCGGAFIKLAHRQFMGGHEFGVKISAVMYMPTSHYSHHSSVVENGKEEEVLDKKSRFENAHVQLQVSLTWSFCTGKVKKNY